MTVLQGILRTIFEAWGIKTTHEDVIVFVLPWLVVWTTLLLYIALTIKRK